MVNLVNLQSLNEQRWRLAKLNRAVECAAVAKRLVAAKARYQSVETKTGVSWPIVAAIHEREASQNWNTQLGQGDPLDRVSTHVPKGRGPFKSWEDAAVDALVNCAPYAARWNDWSPGGALTLLEQYNGLGYASRGMPSPYLWSGTDQYKSGKYIRDGVYDPNKVDAQLGCAALLLAMMSLDPTITFPLAGASLAAPAKPQSRPAAPSITNPSKGSIGAFVASLLAAIFKRK